ncbi:MAG TPA: MFS transporter [Actinoplanes sp.]|nr:MFS transporter [Actinoplanes sp.]
MVAVLALTRIAVVGQLYAAIPLLPAFAAGWHVEPAAATSMISVFAVAYACGALVAGRLIGRYGLRATLVAGTAAVACATVTISLAGSLPVGIVLRAVQGLAAGCYELNPAFGMLLTALGFDVQLRAAAVHRAGGLGALLGHLVLRVELERPYLVDVGFRRNSRVPLRLDTEAGQADPHGRFQVVPAGTDGAYDVKLEYELLYRVDPRPCSIEDFRPTLWWFRTCPQSPFLQDLFCKCRPPNRPPRCPVGCGSSDPGVMMSLPTDVHNRATDCADLPVLFAQAFNTGDLEAADELFEPEAVRVLRPGEVVTGDGRRAATRRFLSLGIPIRLSVRHAYVSMGTSRC